MRSLASPQRASKRSLVNDNIPSERQSVQVRRFVNPGERLKQVRTQLGLTTREVARLSKQIADEERNSEFLASSPWLTQIENEKSAVPSIYKLFTIASFYGMAHSSLLAMYGVDVKKRNLFYAGMHIEKTHLTESFEETEPPSKYLELPIRFDAALNLNEANLLSRMIETWGRVPMEFVQHLDLRHRLYGFFGFDDYTLYPLLRPGSVVEVDPERWDPRHRPVQSEFDRGIYFVDLRSEYACGWCDIIDDRFY